MEKEILDKKKNFKIQGMSCAACAARIENVFSTMEEVSSCQVNLLGNSMEITSKLEEQEILHAVEKAGYKAVPLTNDDYFTIEKDDSKIKNSESKLLLIRLILSLVFLAALMIFPSEKLKMLFSFCVMLINYKFFINGVRGIFHLSPSMDTLVALGSLASFVYGFYDSAAMILTLITVGKMLEAFSKGKTTNAIKDLIKLSPKTAVIIEDGVEKEILVKDLKEGDILIVKAGQNIPVDGFVVEGSSSVNQAAITGESIPVDKTVGDEVTSATSNLNGFLKIKASRVGADTTLAQIIKLVSQGAASKAPVQKIADKVSGVFVPIVIFIALVTFIVWYLLSKDISFSLQRGISVLVISCPCALGLATPVAIMVGSGKAAKNGVLFKNATALEETGKVKYVILDKTGTVTKGEPYVTKIDCYKDAFEEPSQEKLLQMAMSLEVKSSHPIAKAIVAKAKEMNLPPLEISNFEEISGLGVKGILDGKELLCGKSNSSRGIIVRYDNKLIGEILVEDLVKEDSKEAVSYLKKLGLEVVMLTGDNSLTAEKIAEEIGIKEVISNVLPSQKASYVEKYKSKGLTIMVGDGINDAPALTIADVGIAIGAGSDIAIDSADVVLVKNTLMDVCVAIELSRKVYKNIKENLFWAFCYNVIGIPLAAGLFINLMGWELKPVFGAAAMSLSSFCVVSNALRLNFWNFFNKKDIIKEKKGSD